MTLFNFFSIGVFLALVFLILHSLLSKGLRITLGFFLASFLWAFRKESLLPFSSLSPYKFMTGGINRTVIEFTIVLGWIFTFYISWSLAEMILEKTRFFKKSLFMTLLLGIWITTSVSYAVESTGVNIGWWEWRVASPRLSYFFVSGYPLDAVWGWADFFIYFMSAYFLIECSKYRSSKWRFAFVLIPLSYIYFYIFRQFWSLRIFVITGITLLAFLNPLELDYKAAVIGRDQDFRRKVGGLPVLLTFVMISICAAIDIFLIKNPQLLFSKLPIVICALYAANIPGVILFLFPLVLAAIAGRAAAPALVLSAIFLSVKIIDRFKTDKRSLARQMPGISGLLFFIMIAYAVFNPSEPLFFLTNSKEKARISGEINFNGYKEGVIKIGAWSTPFCDKLPPDIAKTQISRPGPFQLFVPKTSAAVYLHAVNTPKHYHNPFIKANFPSGDYRDNPLKIDSISIEGIVIDIQ